MREKKRQAHPVIGGMVWAKVKVGWISTFRPQHTILALLPSWSLSLPTSLFVLLGITLQIIHLHPSPYLGLCSWEEAKVRKWVWRWDHLLPLSVPQLWENILWGDDRRQAHQPKQASWPEQTRETWPGQLSMHPRKQGCSWSRELAQGVVREGWEQWLGSSCRQLGQPG